MTNKGRRYQAEFKFQVALEAAREIKTISQLASDSVGRAEKAGQLIQQIVPDIQQTANLVSEISAACGEQASGAEQINQAVTQLDQVTQQNSATSEEAAAASEELSAQAQNMQGLVGRFKISSNGRGQTPAAGKSPERKALPESHEQDHVHVEAAVAESDLAEF